MARPKRVFTDEEKQLIEEYARNNCYNKTISVALDIPMNTLKRRFGTKIQRWRALGKVELRQNQRNMAKASPQMAIWLGKQELDQVDKQEIKTVIEAVTMTEAEREANEAAAKTFKLRMA